jgi:hypothetical protein
MLATDGPRWFDRATPDPSWPSVGISILITIALFATALVAMQTIGPWHGALSARPDTPVVVRLSPPAPALVRPPVERAPTERLRRVPLPTTVPTAIAPTTSAPRVDAPVVAPAAPSVAVPPGAGADSGVGAVGRGAATAAPSMNGGVFAHGAAMSPAGVVAPRHGGLPAFSPDWNKAPTGEIKASLESSQRFADQMARRATTSGNARDLHVPQGKGVDGVGAVGGGAAGGSLPLPLFSRGPSAAQRKKDEALLRDYRGYLSREALIINGRRAHADSLRADSLRADSIAKARPKIVP